MCLHADLDTELLVRKHSIRKSRMKHENYTWLTLVIEMPLKTSGNVLNEYQKEYVVFMPGSMKVADQTV